MKELTKSSNHLPDESSKTSPTGQVLMSNWTSVNIYFFNFFFRGKPYLTYFDILDCSKVGLAAIALGCPTPAVSTTKFLNFRTPENFAVIYLKFKQRRQTLGFFLKKIAKGTANNEEQSDLGLHCLPRPFCPKT